jgi:hypothetical protein
VEGYKGPISLFFPSPIDSVGLLCVKTKMVGFDVFSISKRLSARHMAVPFSVPQMVIILKDVS